MKDNQYSIIIFRFINYMPGMAIQNMEVISENYSKKRIK